MARPAGKIALPLLGGICVLGSAWSVHLDNKKPWLKPVVSHGTGATGPALLMIGDPTSRRLEDELRITHSEQVSHDTKKITLAMPPGELQTCGVRAGSPFRAVYRPPGKWLTLTFTRQYTPISNQDDPGSLQLLVRKHPSDDMSTHIHTLDPGDTLRLRGPAFRYQYKASATARSLLFIAGGDGIAPMYSITKGILDRPDDQTRIELLWAVDTTRDLVLKRELEDLEKKHPSRLQVTYIVRGGQDSPTSQSSDVSAKIRKGSEHKLVLQEAIDRCKTGNWGDAVGIKLYSWGPPEMEHELLRGAGDQGVLAELRMSPKEVWRFSSEPREDCRACRSALSGVNTMAT